MRKFFPTLIIIFTLNNIHAEDLILNDEIAYLYGEHTYNNVILNGSSGIYVPEFGGSIQAQGTLTIHCDSLYISPNSIIEASGMTGIHGNSMGGTGYQSGSNGSSGYFGGAGGGGFGGAGGSGGGNWPGSGGEAYGDFETLLRGSAGGYAQSQSGNPGKGGGAIKIIGRMAVIKGLIKADGFNGNAPSNRGGHGGGSGGFIYLNFSNITLEDNGFLSARGGDGAIYGTSDNQFAGGGGGGGGRISILTESNVDLAKTSVEGGNGGSYSGNNQPGINGEDGVIYYLKTWLTTFTHPVQDLYYTNPQPIINFDALGDIFGYFYEVSQHEGTIAGQTSNFTSENQLTLDSLSDGTWYIHAVPMNNDFEILEEQHSSYQLNITAGPPGVSSSTHPNSQYVYNNPNPVINIEEVTGIESYYYIFNQNANTVPNSNSGTLLNNNLIMIPGNEDGSYYFHIVAVDSVGHVGTNSAHFQINIGEPSPEITVSPTDISFPSTLIGLEFGDSVTVVEESTNEFISNNIQNGFQPYSMNVYELDILENGDISDLNFTVYMDCNDNQQLNYFSDIKLVSPAGTAVQITQGNIYGYDMYYTTFDDNVNNSINNADAPYDGTYSPYGQLSDFNGENINGTWELRIYSDYWNTADILEEWSLQIATVSTETIPDTTIASRELEFSNSGNADLVISSLSFSNVQDSASFSISPNPNGQSIGSNSSEIFKIYFHPATADTFNTTLTVNTNDPDEPNIAVSLYGIGEMGPQPEIVFGSDTTYFYPDYTNESVVEEIMITNSGEADLVIESLQLSDSTYFHIQEADFASIVANTNRNISISFMSPDTMWHQDTLSIISNDMANPQMQVVLLGKAIVLPAPVISLSTDAMDFGNNFIWSDSSMSFFIENNGDANLFISNLSMDNGSVFSVNPFSIEGPILAGENRELHIVFSPEDTVLYTDTLRVLSNDSNMPMATLALGGRGIIQPPFFTVSDDTLNFGEVEIGVSQYQQLRLFNNGVDTLTVDLVIDTEQFNGFSMSPDFAEIPAYSFKNIDVNFTPLNSGPITNHITAYSNSDEVPVISIFLEGVGVFGDSEYIPRPEPRIDAVVDMPQDQGGLVGIQFTGSDYDCCLNAFEITSYSIWRELTSEGSISEEMIMSITNRENTRTSDSTYWEYMDEFPAVGFANYGSTVATIADSNQDGTFWSKYLVVAHTETEGLFFISNPDSGYSVDNLAPELPTNFNATALDSSIVLNWDAIAVEDLEYYSIHRSIEDDFVVSDETLLLNTLDTALTDLSAEYNVNYYYSLTVSDYNGNISNPTQPVSAMIDVNFAPSIEPIENIITDEDTEPFVVVNVSDQNGDQLTINANSSDENVIPSLSNDTLSFVITQNWFGNAFITVNVFDGELNDEVEFNIDILPVNDAPQAFITLEPQTELSVAIIPDNLNENLIFTWEQSVDVDNDNILYSLIGSDMLSLISQDSIETEEYSISYNSIADYMSELGVTSLTGQWHVIASDSEFTIESSNAPILTISMNVAPEIDPVENIALDEDTPYSFEINVSDTPYSFEINHH